MFVLGINATVMMNHIQFQSDTNPYLQLFNQALANYELVRQENGQVKRTLAKSKLIAKIKRRIQHHS